MSASVSLSIALPPISPLATSASTQLAPDHSGRADDQYVHVSDCLCQSVRSRRDFGFRTVAALGDLAVPFALGILVLDAFGFAGHLLLGRGDLRGGQRVRMRAEGFRIGAAEPVGPAAVMFDDLVGNLGHRVLRCFVRLAPSHDMERFCSAIGNADAVPARPGSIRSARSRRWRQAGCAYSPG